MSIETIVNNALDLIGYPRHIGNIFEGSAAARVALDYWAQTRDTLLQQAAPDWATKNAPLVLLKSAPNIQGTAADYAGNPWSPSTNPPLPWLYEYTAPADMIEPLQIKGQTIFLPEWRPRANSFRHVVTDTETILTNVPNAILVYIYRAIDVDLWQPDFQTLMIQTLAQRMAPEFGKNMPEKGGKDADTPS